MYLIRSGFRTLVFSLIVIISMKMLSGEISTVKRRVDCNLDF